MKILITTDCYIFNLGGITASVLALSAGLRGLGHEVKTLSLSDRSRSFRDGDDYFVRSFPAFYYPGMRMSLALRDPLLEELASWGPDLIHAQTEGTPYLMALRLRKRCGAPLVMTCHTDYGHFIFGSLRSLPPVRALAQAAGGVLYRPAAAVIAPSQKAADFPFLRAARERLTVVPNGMELEKYRRPCSAEERRAFRASLGLGWDAPVLVSVTRLSKEKNTRELISSLPALLERVPGAKLLLVGDGPYRRRLEKLTARLGLRAHVVFTGRVPADEVWRYYAAGDVFVSASTFEVHSMSYLEALAAGLPLLCRADDALLGVLEHGENGLAYRTRAEFAEFAERLLRDGALRTEMGRSSARRADDFSPENFARAALEVYGKALREARKA